MYVCIYLTFCAEARTGGELGHVYNLHCKLLACLSVDASPHHAKWPPASERHRHIRLEAVFSTGIMLLCTFSQLDIFTALQQTASDLALSKKTADVFKATEVWLLPQRQ